MIKIINYKEQRLIQIAVQMTMVNTCKEEKRNRFKKSK